MNAYSVKQLQQYFKNIELVTYALLASGFIGHVFFLEGQGGATNIVLIAIGIIFGVMASITWTPVAKHLLEPIKLDMAEVFSFIRPGKLDSNRNSGGRKAA